MCDVLSKCSVHYPYSMCSLLGLIVCVSSGSKVTSKIFGFLQVGTGQLQIWSMSLSKGRLTSFVKRVNRLTEDLPGDKCV